MDNNEELIIKTREEFCKILKVDKSISDTELYDKSTLAKIENYLNQDSESNYYLSYYFLGDYYSNGRYIESNYDKAKKYFNKSLELITDYNIDPVFINEENKYVTIHVIANNLMGLYDICEKIDDEELREREITHLQDYVLNGTYLNNLPEEYQIAVRKLLEDINIFKFLMNRK